MLRGFVIPALFLLLCLPCSSALAQVDRAQTLLIASDTGSFRMNVEGGSDSIPGKYERNAIRFIDLRDPDTWIVFPVEIGTGGTRSFSI